MTTRAPPPPNPKLQLRVKRERYFRPERQIDVLRRRLTYLENRIKTQSGSEGALRYYGAEISALRWAVQILTLMNMYGAFKNDDEAEDEEGGTAADPGIEGGL